MIIEEREKEREREIAREQQARAQAHLPVGAVVGALGLFAACMMLQNRQPQREDRNGRR